MSRVVKVTALIITLSLLTLGVISNSFTAQEVVGIINPPPSFFDDDAYNGCHYYLHTFNEDTPPYLRPESPDLANTSQRNRARISSGAKTFFPFARAELSPLEDKYDDDPELFPRISLVVNSGTTPGKALRFEIWFDFDGLAKQESDVEVKALFDTYFFLTTGESEVVDLTASEIQGTWQDFSEEPNEGNIKLVVWREDNQTDDMFIYCGAYKSVSWLIVPFSYFRNVTPPDNGEDNGSPVKTIAFILIVIGVAVIAVVAYYFYWRKTKYIPEEEEEDALGKKKRSTSEQRRMKKDRQMRKSKRFYRDK